MKYVIKPQKNKGEGFCNCSNCPGLSQGCEGYNANCPNQMAYCEYFVSSENGGLNSDNARTVWNIICFWD